MQPIKTLLRHTIATKLLILGLDIVLSGLAYLSAVVLRFNLEVKYEVLVQLPLTITIILLTRLLAFYLFKTYSGIIKYAGIHDVIRIVAAITLSKAIVLLIYLSGSLPQMFFAYSVSLIDYAIVIFFMLAYRIGLVAFFRYVKPSHRTESNKVNVLIYGAGNTGVVTKRTLESDHLFNYRVIAFYDEDESVASKLLDGIRVFNKEAALRDIVSRMEVKKVIMAKPASGADERKDFVDVCLDLGLEVLKIPPVQHWMNGRFQATQLQHFHIEDLLDRDPITLDSEHIRTNVTGKIVLVTGAAGSIGRELVRQLAYFGPSKLILLDKSESPLHDLHLAVQEDYHLQEVVAVLGDIASARRMEEVFDAYRPDIVYHAAAYKHVPILEAHPYEAVKNNIMGTRVVADLALKHGAERFVMVSTDKAVNPTNVMGASKRIAEIYVQALNSIQKKVQTQFIITRFGNVLGSDGSVIPRFKKQIEAGGPVTVTSPDITRYFMTIPEACQLILEASTMGNSGEIFIFDMGKSVKIVDLARKMIRLAGFEPDKEIPIVFTGLRQGEKIEEELLNQSENVVPTYNKKIMIAKDKHDYTYAQVEHYMNELKNCLEARDDMAMVRRMKNMVPEFISNNSQYQVLDAEDVLVAELSVSDRTPPASNSRIKLAY